MNCYTESFFQNCSLIAPSRLSGCMFIYCSIAPPWLILSHIPLLIFLSCLSSTTNMKKFLVSQVALTTVWTALSLESLSPACGSQRGAFRSAFLQLGTPAQLQLWKLWRSGPSWLRVPEELHNTPQPKCVMWSQVIFIILFLELYGETYFACILDFLLLHFSLTQKINRCPQNLLGSPFL